MNILFNKNVVIIKKKQQFRSIHLTFKLFDQNFNNMPCSIDPSHGLNSDQIEIQSMATKFANEQMKPFMAEWYDQLYFCVNV